jgi:hypothetical protein
MECPHKECSCSDDCSILDIIKKIPKKKENCSYFKPKKVIKNVQIIKQNEMGRYKKLRQPCTWCPVRKS